MPYTFTLQSPGKLNDRVRKVRKHLKGCNLAVPASDLQHSLAIFAGQKDWQTLHAAVSAPEVSKPTGQFDIDQILYQHYVKAVKGKTGERAILNAMYGAEINRGDVCDHAFVRAIEELHANWTDSLNDGFTLTELLSDVDEICSMLQTFKAAALDRISAGAEVEAAREFKSVVVECWSNNPELPSALKVEMTENLLDFIRGKMRLAKAAGTSGMRFIDFPGRYSSLTWYANCPEDVESGETEGVASYYQDCPVLIVDESCFHFECYAKHNGDSCESEQMVLDAFVNQSAATSKQTCKKCESVIGEDGYCADETCPFSDWPQQVDLDDLHEMSTGDVELKYKVKKRPQTSWEQHKLFDTCSLCGTRRPVDILDVGVSVSKTCLEEKGHHFKDGDDVAVCSDCQPDVEM